MFIISFDSPNYILRKVLSHFGRRILYAYKRGKWDRRMTVLVGQTYHHKLTPSTLSTALKRDTDQDQMVLRSDLKTSRHYFNWFQNVKLTSASVPSSIPHSLSCYASLLSSHSFQHMLFLLFSHSLLSLILALICLPLPQFYSLFFSVFLFPPKKLKYKILFNLTLK